MTVTNVCFSDKPPAGSFSDSDELSVSYVVTTDDPLDGPQTIKGIFGNSLPGPDTIPSRGGAWSWGNDSSGSAIVTSHDVQRTKRNAGGATWIVTPKFERSSDEPDQPNPSGGKATDPTQVQNILLPGYRLVSRPVQKAEFLGWFNKNGTAITPPNATMTIGEEYPIQNTALIPYIPVPERLVGMKTLTLKKYYRPWNHDFDDAIQKVNNAPYTVDYKDGSGTSVYNRTFETGTLLLNSVTPSHSQFGDQVWYYVSIEFWIDADGFNKDRPDRGLTEIADATVTPLSWKPIKNDIGENISEARWLNGSGGVLTTPKDSNTHVYLRYREFKEYNFGSLGIVY